MVIAFCTSCMNRRWQIERTLPFNLEALKGTPHFLAVCDYHSGDNLEELLRQHQADIDAQRLVCFRTTEPVEFHASRAKNTAHRLALRRRPDVLFNLDADNFITPEAIKVIETTFMGRSNAYLHHWSGEADGSYGRIALRTDDWLRIGGYDETLLGMAWQDTDLLSRARALELTYVLECQGLTACVENTLEQKLANIPAPAGARAGSPAVVFQRLLLENWKRSQSRPIRQDVHAQHRFRGQLNFIDDVVL